MQAAIARAYDNRTASRASLRRALEEAKSQQAPWLELMALNALCDVDVGNVEDRKALATLVARMPEASDTDAIAKARTLLAK